MRDYMINNSLYKLSVKNGTDNNMDQIFDKTRTVIFLIVYNFKIDHMDCNQNTEDTN